MALRVIGAALSDAVQHMEPFHENQDILNLLIQQCLGHLSGSDLFRQRVRHTVLIKITGHRHLDVQSVFRGLHRVVDASPVGYDHAVKAPFPAENVLQQVMVMAAVFSAEPVVGAHQRLRLSLFHRGLEAGEIELSERPLVHGSVHIEPAGLLII